MTRKSRSAILHGARVRDGSSKAYESAWEEFERKFGFGMEIVPFELRQSLSRFAMGPIRAMFGATAEYPTLPAQGTYKGWDITSKLSTLRMPTLVLAGELDGSGPDASRVIHRSISGSWLVLMPGTGHTGFYQRREEYMQILRDFLDSTRTRKPRVARSGARRRSVSRARDGHWPDPVLRARPVDRESSVGAIDIAPTTPREWSEPAETREHTD